MRKSVLLAFAAAALTASTAIAVRAQSQSSDSQDKSANPPAASTTTQPAPGSLADAARKAREQKKDSKPAKVFTNDNLPTSGGISTVGNSSQSAPGTDQGATSTTAAAPAGEKEWRARFADLHHKLDQDQAALDVAQREANVDEVQFYGGDPQKGAQDQMSQQPMGTDYTKKKAEIEAKQKQVADDQQAISDAEDELRKSGGDPGWAR